LRWLQRSENPKRRPPNGQIEAPLVAWRRVGSFNVIYITFGDFTRLD